MRDALGDKLNLGHRPTDMARLTAGPFDDRLLTISTLARPTTLRVAGIAILYALPDPARALVVGAPPIVGTTRALKSPLRMTTYACLTFGPKGDRALVGSFSPTATRSRTLCHR